MREPLSSLLFILALATFPACGTVPPNPGPGPGPAPPPAYTCSTYCDNALLLGCSFAQPAPGDGATCVEVCESATSVVRWDLSCRSTAATCELINACERRE